MTFPIRSPRHQTGGIYVFARILDKIRLKAEGKLPAGYHVGIVPGNRTFDDRVCRFLGVDFDALNTRTLQGGTDDDVLEWCFKNGRKPDAEQIEIWNGFMSKRGWRDSAQSGFDESKAAAGFADRDDLQCYFDLMDAEEGRGVVSEREAIFSRIREALTVIAPRPGSHDPAPLASARNAAATAREWLPAAGASPAEWLAHFAKNSIDLKTRFHVADDLAAAHALLVGITVEEGWRRIGTHEGDLAPAAADATGLPVLRVREGYDANDLEQCDAGLTECDALIAQTGSVLLTTRSGGGRALSVLPPHHVVIARRDQLVPDLPAAYALLHEKYGPTRWPSMMTLITGPSRTGDIERIIILGAHGPKKLTVIVF